MVWGGSWEGGSGLGTRIHLWWIHVDVRQNQYNIVKQLASNLKKINDLVTEQQQKWTYFHLSDATADRLVF